METRSLHHSTGAHSGARLYPPNPPTAGTTFLVCGIVLVEAGSYVASELGGLGGELIGETIYKVLK